MDIYILLVFKMCINNFFVENSIFAKLKTNVKYFYIAKKCSLRNGDKMRQNQRNQTNFLTSGS